MASVDLKDPDLYLHGVPYATFAALRKEASLHWNPESDGAGFWSVLGYEDITAISKDPKTFSSAYANGGHRIFNENDLECLNDGSPTFLSSTLTQSAPDISLADPVSATEATWRIADYNARKHH
jgi:linalool 8-monooxygenase